MKTKVLPPLGVGSAQKEGGNVPNMMSRYNGYAALRTDLRI